jgi:hypothetical protein
MEKRKMLMPVKNETAQHERKVLFDTSLWYYLFGGGWGS